MQRIQNQILSLLASGSYSIWHVIDYQDASLPEFFEIIEEMEREGIIRMENGILSLTEKGKELAKDKEFHDFQCKRCMGTGYDIWEDVKKEYEKIASERPLPDARYDQGYISIDGVMRRLSFIFERGDLYGDIFIAGDDDLFSIAAGLSGLPSRIVVVEIDERLVNFINRVASEYGLKVEAFSHDLQNDIGELKKKFDVFVTDPVETLPGITLFLSRCVEALKGIGSSGYFGLTTLEASRHKWYEIQRMLHEMGFVITDIRRKFNVYPDDGKNFFSFQQRLPVFKKIKKKNDYNWYTSSLYRIEAVKEPKALVRGWQKLGEALYHDDESWVTPE